MPKHRDLHIPDGLDDVCGPEHLARRSPNACSGSFEAPRRAAVGVFFTRHMSLPNRLIGISQLRTAMAWQPKERVEEVVSPFLRDSPGFELAPELAPRDSQAIFDKLSMSAFEDIPLGFALRDAQVSAFANRRRPQVGIEPTVRPGADRGLIPVVVADACGAETKRRQSAGSTPWRQRVMPS
jgi:biuret amidohydrolase